MRLHRLSGVVTFVVHCSCGQRFNGPSDAYEDWRGWHRGHGGFSERALPSSTAVPDHPDADSSRPLRPKGSK